MRHSSWPSSFAMLPLVFISISVVYPLASVVQAVEDISPAAVGYRPLTGHGNNLANPQWGAYKSAFVRLSMPAAYSDNISAPSGTERPAPRLISNVVFGAESSKQNHAQVSDLLPYWGQLIAHDIALTTKSKTGEAIPMSFSQCELRQFRESCSGNVTIPFPRAKPMDDDTPLTQRRPENSQTAYIDGSVVYGASEATMNAVRSFQDGKLKVYIHPETEAILLPLVDSPEAAALMDTAYDPHTTDKLFLAGDPRANVHPALQALHTLLVREHNRKAMELAVTVGKTWDDEKLFQRARAWVTALMQKITYEEYLPLLLGRPLPTYQGYDSGVSADIDLFFVGAAFRYGHSAIGSLILRIAEDGSESPSQHLILRDNFFRTKAILESGGDIESILRGLTIKVDQAIDTLLIDDLRNHFVDAPYDLAAMNIQRGRDYGLPSYNVARKMFGLRAAKDFQNLTGESIVSERLSSVYRSVEDVDGWVGGLAEAREVGADGEPAHLGPLFTRSILEQFVRLRDGDRFWYQRSGVLSANDTREITSWSLSKVVTMNCDMPWFPSQPMKVSTATAYKSHSGSGGSGGVETGEGGSLGSSGGGGIASSFLQLASDFRLEWAAAEGTTAADKIIEFTMCANFSGWMGIGFNAEEGLMAGAEMIVAYKDAKDQPWTVKEYHASGYSTPDAVSAALIVPVDAARLDASQACHSTSGVRFRRPANAPSGDTAHVSLLSGTGGSTPYLIYAYSKSSLSFGYHGMASKGATQASFSTVGGGGAAGGGSSVPNSSTYPFTPNTNHINSIIVFHAFVMLSSFGILFPYGVYVARYQNSKENWVELHRVVMGMGTTEAVSLAVTVLVGGSRLILPHGLLGLIMSIVLVAQSAAGEIIMNPKYTLFKRFYRLIRRFHIVTGWIVLCMGAVTCFFGLRLMFAGDPKEMVALAVYGAWNAIILFFFIVVGQLRWRPYWYRRFCRWRERREKKMNPNGKPLSTKASAEFTAAEFAKRVAQGAKWIVIQGCVYDIGGFIQDHPGGEALMTQSIGKDVTSEFTGEEPVEEHSGELIRHRHSKLALSMLNPMQIGKVADDAAQLARFTSNNNHKRGLDGKSAPITPREESEDRGFVPVEIKELQRVTTASESKVYRIVLSLPPSKKLLQCEIGGHVMLELASPGSGLARVARPYSPIQWKSDGELVLYIKIYAQGAFTSRLQELLSTLSHLEVGQDKKATDSERVEARTGEKASEIRDQQAAAASVTNDEDIWIATDSPSSPRGDGAKEKKGEEREEKTKNSEEGEGRPVPKLYLKGPQNSLLPSHILRDGLLNRLVLIAGGTGLAPMLCVLDYYYAHREDSSHPIHIDILVSQRSTSSAFLEEELLQFVKKARGRRLKIRICRTFTGERAENKEPFAETFFGRVNQGLMRGFLPHDFPPPKASKSLFGASFSKLLAPVAEDELSSKRGETEARGGEGVRRVPPKLRELHARGAMIHPRGRDEVPTPLLTSPSNSLDDNTSKGAELKVHVVICGPRAFNEHVETLLVAMGCGSSNITTL